MYEHLHEIFWPSVQPGGGDDLGLGWFQIACLVVFNLVALPLLPFVPKACALDDHWLRLIRLDCARLCLMTVLIAYLPHQVGEAT